MRRIYRARRSIGQRARFLFHAGRSRSNAKRRAKFKITSRSRKIAVTNFAEHLQGWLPVNVGWQATEPRIEWHYAAGQRFTEPFFEQTVARLHRRPFNRLFTQRTKINVLEECFALRKGLPPKGFIFHLSRCGSTLVSQILAALPRNIVISEAPPLDSIIRAGVFRPTTTDDEKIAWLQWMVAAIGQNRDSQAEQLFIKFDSWNTLDLDLISRAFPAVPWIFLYRHPLEVLVSHRRVRGMGMVTGLIKHRAITRHSTNLDEYATYILSLICASVLKQQCNPNAQFVNYTQLPQFVTSTLLKHFQLACTDEESAFHIRQRG